MSVSRDGLGTGQASSTGLRRGGLGLLAVAGLAAVVMSPSLALYFNWGPIATSTGPIAPWIFFAALVVSIPSAISYAMVSKELPSAGQAYTWLWRSFTPTIGVWIGIILFFYYMSSAGWGVPMYFAMFFQELMVYFGAPSTAIWSVLGVLVLMGLTALVVFRDIKVNAEIAVGFLLFETLAVAALAVTILVAQAQHGGLTLEPLKLSAATNGIDGILGALVFGILSFIGFDYACVVAEEAKTPKRLMPVAVILSTVLVGLFWIICSYALSVSIPLGELPGYLASGSTPITPIAHSYWGRGDILIIITGLTAATGIYIAAVPVLARVLFAMGRDGVVPRRLASLNPTTRTPQFASIVVMVLCTVGTLGMAAAQRSFYNTFVWFGQAAVFFALVTYIAVNAANITFYRRFRRAKFNLFTNLLIPVAGIAVDLYILWRAFFGALWATGFALGSSVVLFALGVSALAAVYVVVLRRRSPQLFTQNSFVLPDLDEDSEPSTVSGEPSAR